MRRLGNRIVRVVAALPDSFTVTLEFADHFVGEVDLNDIFGTPRGLAAEVLKGGMFDKCVESGALAWPNGLELCPDAVRASIARRKHHAA